MTVQSKQREKATRS